MRIVRRLTHVLVLVLTLIVGAAAAAIIVAQTAWFKNWLRVYIERQANLYLNGKMSIGRLGGNLFFGVELENIGVSMDGTEIVAVKDLGLDYNVFQLVAKGLTVDNIRLNKPVVYLRREGDTWSLTRLIKKQEQEADRRGPENPITIDDIGISDGSIVFDGPVGTSGVEVPKRFDHLDAKLNFKYEPVHYSIEISHVSFRGSEPSLALNALSGGVAVREDTLFLKKLALRTEETSVAIEGAVQNYLSRPVLNLQITSDKTSIPEIARIVPSLAGIKLQPAYELKLDGPADRLRLEANVRSSAGQIIAKLLTDVQAPGNAASGTVSIRHLDLAPLLKNPAQRSDITADAKLDVRAESFSNLNSMRGAVHVDAPRVVAAGYAAENIHADARINGRRVALNGSANAYGAAATTAGTVVMPEGRDPVAFDLHGRARNLDLRKLPRTLDAPPAATNVNAAYAVKGHAPAGSSPGGRPLDVAGSLTFEPSTVAGARIAAGSTIGFDVRDKSVGYTADATIANLDLERVGREFNVPALASDRYKSDINGHVTAKGHGTTPKEMDVAASGTLSNTAILGGTIPNLTFDAAMAHDTAHVKANGTFARFDPALASGKPAMKGDVTGALDVDATVDHPTSGVTADSVAGRINATLDPSTIGGLAIDTAKIDADYRNSSGDIRALEIHGRDLNVQASGALALNETGQSNLKFHADSSSLATIGKLVDQPITGIAKTDGTVTGNKRELQASGNLVGDGVRYEENGALALSSTYSVKLPDLTPANSTVSATTRATFVTLGGQNINELNAKTDYANKRLDFDATAKQPKRSLGVGGSVLLHPDHQEIHVQKLALDAQGQQWQLAPGTEATVSYAADAVDVRHFTLVSGNQKIAADGVFGKAGNALDVTMTNVELASVDAMLLRPPQLSGKLNASGTITGTKDAPHVKGAFAVNQGAFRQFKYDSFAGTVDYGGRGATVDARLQQNPSAWITAKGYMPVAAFSVPTTGRAHREAAAPEDRIDLHIDSSPIDLGVVQGFTTALTNVTGTVQAKVDVTGAADDPHPSGAITVAKGALTVEPTGVAYTNIDGRIELQPDRVHVPEIRVLDNRQHAMIISGDLGVHELQVGAFTVGLKADDFKVLDNKMGNVRINSDLRMAGELTQPRLEGDLGVATGMINLDPILAMVGDSAYATKPLEYETKPGAAGPEGQTPPPSAFDALRMNVHVTVPDDLVVKASDLRAGPDAPLSLGALNVTLGGDLRAEKDAGSQIRLVGLVRTIRGTYDFQGRRFEILRDGSVRFEGFEELNPALDLRTRRIIQGVEARVTVRGRLQTPEIELSSSPPLEQADILALIVFNQPLNSLGEGQQITLAQRAQGIAAGAVASQLAGSIGEALNLNTFEIQMAPDSGATAQLTIGQQISQNLFVKVQQDVGDQSATNFIFEYQLKEWLRLQSNVLQGSSTQQSLFRRAQGSGADLIFTFSY